MTKTHTAAGYEQMALGSLKLANEAQGKGEDWSFYMARARVFATLSLAAVAKEAAQAPTTTMISPVSPEDLNNLRVEAAEGRSETVETLPVPPKGANNINVEDHPGVAMVNGKEVPYEPVKAAEGGSDA